MINPNNNNETDKYEWWKNVVVPLRGIITILSFILIFFYIIYGWYESYGLLGVILVIGIPLASLYAIFEYLIKKKVKREIDELKKKDDEWLDEYIKNQ